METYFLDTRQLIIRTGTEPASISFALGGLVLSRVLLLWPSFVGESWSGTGRLIPIHGVLGDSSAVVEMVFDCEWEDGLRLSGGADRVTDREIDRARLSWTIVWEKFGDSGPAKNSTTVNYMNIWRSKKRYKPLGEGSCGIFEGAMNDGKSHLKRNTIQSKLQ